MLRFVVMQVNTRANMSLSPPPRKKAFTLIELLIVISIIGILSVSLLPAILSAPASARDVIRKKALIEMQAAVERYYDDKGVYPTIAGGVWWGACANFGSHPTSGVTGYIPSLAPDYIKALPLDPMPNLQPDPCTMTNSCYRYRSDGVNYKILASCTYEGTYPSSGEQFYDVRPYALMVCGGASATLATACNTW